MKGKSKKSKALKISILCISFLLTIVLTVSLTLAWFYDSDWASNYIQMGGPVGIVMKGELDDEITSGVNKLHMNLNSGRVAYPGQSVTIRAQVENNGEQVTKITNDGSGGQKTVTEISASDCFIRAHFAVYTNMQISGSTDSQIFNANILSEFVQGLIDEQNAKFTANAEGAPNYYWYYHQETGTKKLSTSGLNSTDLQYYLDGKKLENDNPLLEDRGYYYLCTSENHTMADTATNAILKPVSYQEKSLFLWNSSIIIPWQLTNVSADTFMIVEVIFQAIQTFIPVIDNGIINKDKNNELQNKAVGEVAVQTLFSSCGFTNIGDNGKITINADTPSKDDDWQLTYKNPETGEAILPFQRATKRYPAV